MKSRLFIIVLLLIPVFCGCEKSIDEKIIGKWYLYVINEGDGIYHIYNKYDKNNTTQILTFYENGTYDNIYRSSKYNETGEWSIDSNTLILTRKNDNGFIVAEEVLEISIFDDEGEECLALRQGGKFHSYKRY